MFRQLFVNQHGSVKDRWTSELKRMARLSGVRRVDPLLFCHLPKCAGTSFRAVIEAEYHPKQRLFLYNKDELNLPTPSAEFLERFRRIRKDVQIIYGHFAFGMHRFLDVPPCYATILREPIARVISLYYHFSRTPDSAFFEQIKDGLSLKEFAGVASNHMTELLAGGPEEPNGVLQRSALLDQAKENIQKYFCVIGTIDSIDDVLRILGRRFGWRNHAIPTLNVKPDLRVEIDQETREAIVEHNRLDLALYEWIKVVGYRTFT